LIQGALFVIGIETSLQNTAGGVFLNLLDGIMVAGSLRNSCFTLSSGIFSGDAELFCVYILVLLVLLLLLVVVDIDLTIALF